MTIDITQLLLALISLAGVAITTFLIPWIRSKTTAVQMQQLAELAWLGVNAAEAIYKGSGLGEAKYEYVKTYLKNNGVVFDDETILAAIETAVAALKKQ